MSISRSIRSKGKKIATKSLTSSSSSQSGGGGRTLLQRKELRRQKSRSAKAGAARTERSASSSSSPPRRRFWRLSIKRDGEGKRRHRFPQHRRAGKVRGVFSLFFFSSPFVEEKEFRVFSNMDHHYYYHHHHHHHHHNHTTSSEIWDSKRGRPPKRRTT